MIFVTLATPKISLLSYFHKCTDEKIFFFKLSDSRNGAVHTCTAGIPCWITQCAISGLCNDAEVVEAARIQVIDCKLGVTCCFIDGSIFALPGQNIIIAFFGVSKVGP